MYNSKVIIALDFNSREESIDFLNKFGKEKLFVKIGMELFYKEGPSIVKEIKEMGHNVFLDLKLFDIPHTVSQALISLESLNVDFVTVHLMGGNSMLQVNNNINLLGVTVLTSSGEEDMLSSLTIEDAINELVPRAINNNLYGIICSAKDIKSIKENHDTSNIKFVTPGIRTKDSSNDDQKRVVSPKEAIELGSDYLVIGRSITNSDNPVRVYNQIINEL
ncbi:MAG: orotidine-5'-phosphate decarboxylase [Mycoplasmatales bacterium]